MYKPSTMALFKNKDEFLRCWVARQQLIIMIIGMQTAAEMVDDEDWENLHDLAEYPDEGDVEMYMKMEEQLGKIYKTKLSETLCHTPEFQEVDDSNKKLLRSLKRMRAIGNTLSTTEWEMFKKEATVAEKVNDRILKPEHVSQTPKENRNKPRKSFANIRALGVYNQVPERNISGPPRMPSEHFIPTHVKTSGGMYIGYMCSNGGRILNRQVFPHQAIQQDYVCVDGRSVDTNGGFAIMHAIAENDGSIENENVEGLETYAENKKCQMLPFNNLGNSDYEDGE